jgi:hypothetical protein
VAAHLVAAPIADHLDAALQIGSVQAEPRHGLQVVDGLLVRVTERIPDAGRDERRTGSRGIQQQRAAAEP